MTVFTHGNINLIHGDNMDFMRGLPDKAFSLAIVDPPYGIKATRPIGKYARNAIDYTKESEKEWDSSVPSQDYFGELFRVSNNQIIWGANYFSSYLPPSMGWICWYKTNEVKGCSFSEIELAFSSFQRAARHFEFRPFIKSPNRIHPTQKPIALYSYVLQNYAKPGDTILDTHLGSGSSAIAAYRLGYAFTGIELDKDYYDASVARFKKETLQTSWLIPSVEEDKPVQKGMF